MSWWWPFSRKKPPAALLMQNSGYVLREDGSRILLEA